MVDGYVPPTVIDDDRTTGRSSPSTTRAASIQNSGLRTSSAASATSMRSWDTTRVVNPIVMTAAR